MLTSGTYTVEVAGVTFSDSESAPIPKFVNPGPAIFKFEDPTPVQIPAAITDLTVIYPCFYLGNNHTDSCFCRNWKMTPDRGPVIHNFLTPDPDPGPKQKHRILPDSTSALRIRCQAKFLTCEISDFTSCTYAQSNVLHTKNADKTYYKALGLRL